MAEAAKKEASEKKKSSSQKQTTAAGVPGLPEVPEVPKTDPTAGTLSSATGSSSSGDSGGKIKNITINIEKLIEQFTISTSNLAESSDRVKEAVLEALMGALNDTQLATE